MATDDLHELAATYLNTLCVEISERCVGSEGNRSATRFFAQEIRSLGWDTQTPEFEAVDWNNGGATLRVDGRNFQVLVSPYSLGCDVTSRVVSATSTPDLEALDAQDRIIFLYGDIAKEQIMPKNFVFYNPEEHRKIVALLEKSGARALICATGRNAALAGGVYPFPLIEDGDFNIPSVYMTEEEGARLLPFVGGSATLTSVSERIPGTGCNVIGRKESDASPRIVVTAHIDAKKGTPGAIDNATGVIVLLLLARLLKEYRGPRRIEIVALNGEDYYAVPGQMNYVLANQGKFEEIILNINIDGAGYRMGKSTFSFFGVPEPIRRIADEVLKQFPGITEGVPWPQGDHSIFVQYGRPAIAVSSEWFTENINAQEITHTARDNPEIVDIAKVVELSEAVDALVREL